MSYYGKKFQLPEAFKKGRVLVVGMGGGCDVITAYVSAMNIPGLNKETVMWANTKRTSKNKDKPADGNYAGTEAISPKGLVSKVTGSCKLEAGSNYYGTNAIDKSLPKGPNGCPFILTVPRVEETGGKCNEGDLKALAEDIKATGLFDCILGVDAGGDSVTGGIDHNGDPTTGVDQMCARALKYTGLPFIHCVPGFGCDGESSKEIIEASIAAEEERKTYMGCLSMAQDNWQEQFSALSKVLGASRTPNIMASAADEVVRLEMEEDLKASHPLTAEVVVDRGLKPKIPLSMLMHAFFFARTV